MAETLLQFQAPVSAPDGTRYAARAVGASFDAPGWQGWLEFVPIGGGPILRSPRETTQPNRADVEYWATGLTQVYLDGALVRAIQADGGKDTITPRRADREGLLSSSHDGAAAFRGHSTAPQAGTAVLDPFSVYRKGEALLRSQLMALSPWHLANIALDYELTTEDRAALERRSSGSLTELIVREVQARAGERTRA